MERHPKVNPPDYTICPHCGNYTLHKLQYRDDYYEPYVDVEDVDHKWYALLRCTTCNKPSLYIDFWDEENSIWISKLAYPLPPLAPKEVPKDIRDAFNEAVSVLQNSPSLCAVGIRRCLEGVCSNQNASGRTLQEKISFLVS